MATHKLIVLDDSLLTTISQDRTFLTELPFLAGVRPTANAGGCSSCNNAPDRVRSETFAAAKRTIAGLPAEKKRKLKELLNAQKLRVIYRRADNVITHLTF